MVLITMITKDSLLVGAQVVASTIADPVITEDQKINLVNIAVVIVLHVITIGIKKLFSLFKKKED